MTCASTIAELHGFLARHEPVAKPRLLAIGSVLGGWRVVAFIGSGGNAEVYRVVRDADGLVAAVKILLKDDDASRKRFAQEMSLLSAGMDVHFAKFYDSGSVDGRPYIVSELLEPIDLPRSECEIANYLLTVCLAVDTLHRAGLVHRDIKPSNIMRRTNGELVLIDFGLVKDTYKSSEPEREVSIVSGKVVAVGTPRFAAPEQMIGGKVTFAADIHAIGRMADVAFESDPPNSWKPIIRRATSSIPEQRYKTVGDLALAIRRRDWPRRIAVAAGVAAVGLVTVAIVGVGRSWPRETYSTDDSVAWSALCSNGTTNVVDMKLVSDNDNYRTYLKTPRAINATFVRLGGVTNTFEHPIELLSDREYFIEGPGLLSADFRASGKGATVHLARCFVVNRSAVPVGSAAIRYVFDRGAYLNFPLADEPDRETFRSCFGNYDAAFNDIRFGGPETPRGLMNRRHEEQMDQIRRATQSFCRKFHPSRHFSALWRKYAVEGFSILCLGKLKTAMHFASDALADTNEAASWVRNLK